ncbi:purine transporter [Moniliophthora roreri]|nr:purine transporter [Moniliophthora roreri]
MAGSSLILEEDSLWRRFVAVLRYMADAQIDGTSAMTIVVTILKIRVIHHYLARLRSGFDLHEDIFEALGNLTIYMSSPVICATSDMPDRPPRLLHYWYSPSGNGPRFNDRYS